MQMVAWKSKIDEQSFGGESNQADHKVNDYRSVINKLQPNFFCIGWGVATNLADREAHWWQQLLTLPQYMLDSDSCANTEQF